MSGLEKIREELEHLGCSPEIVQFQKFSPDRGHAVTFRYQIDAGRYLGRECALGVSFQEFGSRARGDARPDSDVDLLVVEAEPFGRDRNCVAESLRLREALGVQGIDKDILVCSLDDLEYWRDSLNNVLARALREGEVLYERP